MTQEDIIRRIIEQDGCQGISCDGSEKWNQGVRCPLSKEGGCPSLTGVALEAKAWVDEHGLLPYSSTFTIAHRFKPGDRVQHKDAKGAQHPVATITGVVFAADCGFLYRFAEYGVPSGLVSYCDENLRLADCDDEVEKAKETEQ
jgi:hypothetical protein